MPGENAPPFLLNMSSGNCSTVEGSMQPTTHSHATVTNRSQDTENACEDDKTEERGKKRKRSRGRRGRCSGDQATDKPRRERANFNAAQLHALERLFQDQKYPDGDLRAKIAERLDLNEERVQIWFQNRRAKYKRLQREGSRTAPDDPSSRTSHEYSQPSSVDYIPPQLDADMLGPGPCTIQNFPQLTTDNHETAPAPAAGVSTHPQQQSATAQGAPHGLGPFPNGHQEQQLVGEALIPHDNSTLEWLNWSEPIQGVGSLQFTDAMHHQTSSAQSVGKLTGPETVEFPAVIGQTPVSVAGQTAPSTHIPGNFGSMCPTVESCSTDNSQRGGVATVPRVHSETGGCVALCRGSVVGPTDKRCLTNGGVSPAAPPPCSRSKSHSGETPCHKDSKCITCREKPPPNQVCTVLPAGQRNELDEALYRCAVGSILEIRSLDPSTHGQTNGTALSATPRAQSTTSVTGSLAKPFPEASAGPKSVRNPRENPVTAQRRMAMARKQRQLEAEYLSSSSDTSSDSEEETQRMKRRRKVARRPNSSAPPNRVCTAVPLIDRTLPLPCLTKDLALDNYFNETPSGQLLQPVERYPSCLPSPVSLDRLSSPEPRSSPSEHPKYSSSSSSDLSDFEYIPPRPKSHALPSTTRKPAGSGSAGRNSSSVHKPATVSHTQCDVKEETASAHRTDLPCNQTVIQHGGFHPPYMPRQELDYMSTASFTYPDGASAQTASEAMHRTRSQGVLSSIPPPFVMQLDPATLSSSDSSDKQTQARNGRRPASASDQNRQNQTCEILAESRVIGEMCSSPASPWSCDSSRQSPYPYPTSPQTQQLYNRQAKLVPNKPNASTYKCTQSAPSTVHVPVPSTHSRHHLTDSGAKISPDAFMQSARSSTFDGYGPFPPYSPHNNYPASVQPITGYYSPNMPGFEPQKMYDQPVGGHQEFSVRGGGNAFRDYLPMRSLERAPPTQQHVGAQPQNGYGVSDFRYRREDNDNIHDIMTGPAPPNRLCTSTTDFMPPTNW